MLSLNWGDEPSPVAQSCKSALELSHGQNFVVAALATGFSMLPFGNIFKLNPAEVWEGFIFPLMAHGRNWSVLLAVGCVPSCLPPAVDRLKDGWRGHETRPPCLWGLGLSSDTGCSQHKTDSRSEVLPHISEGCINEAVMLMQ